MARFTDRPTARPRWIEGVAEVDALAGRTSAFARVARQLIDGRSSSPWPTSSRPSEPDTVALMVTEADKAIQEADPEVSEKAVDFTYRYYAIEARRRRAPSPRASR
ncbi:MAG: hypothetical protein R2705_06830 [Ilumatobacteraceae bacterium]